MIERMKTAGISADIEETVWPNCSVPDCSYKSCISLNSDKCYAHTVGRPVIPYDEYMSEVPDE